MQLLTTLSGPSEAGTAAEAHLTIQSLSMGSTGVSSLSHSLQPLHATLAHACGRLCPKHHREDMDLFGKTWISSGSLSLQVLCHRAPQLPLDPVLKKRESRGHLWNGSCHIPLPCNLLHPELLRLCLSSGPVFIFCLAFSFRLCGKYLTQKHGLLSKMRAAAEMAAPWNR